MKEEYRVANTVSIPIQNNIKIKT